NVCLIESCQVLITVSIQARCTLDDKWIPCETSVPGTKAILDCQNGYRPENNLLFAQGNTVTCNMNGQWEPEPMRCVLACGSVPPDVKSTVIGGVRPNITEFPWHASLYRDEPDKGKKYFCGASVIRDRFLITAAHCVFDENIGQLYNASKIYVVVGNLFRDYDYLYHNRTFVKYNQVKHIYIAHNYLGLIGNYLWDIAILELVRPFKLTTWLVPICIDTANDKSAVEVGSYGKVAGFGRTAHGETSAILQALTVPIISFSQCISASQNASTRQFITNDKLCAGYRNGSSVCDGDSGGGLVVKTNNTWYLRGIVSVSLGTIQDGGIAHCDNNLYTLYTEVSRHVPWIQQVISNVERDQRLTLCSNESYTRCS
ncbi:PREDICTED: coagulation factor IX-like, partial [Wasmannia auropunctata]|uniref:coagulation factor IX-like n=1 Tax=Wasmannia auropunctata TaxID=64793 RepID=UPI0005EFD16C